MKVYVIGQEEGPCKIGISKDPARRAADLQTGCPFRLDVLHHVECRDYSEALWLENTLHEVHQDRRLIGEWFDMSAAEAVDAVCAGFEIKRHFEDRQ